MRSIGMRDAKDHKFGERLSRMSTWQQSTPAPRLWRALVGRVALAPLFASTVFFDDRSVALRVCSGVAAVAFVAMAFRIVWVLLAQSRNRAE